MKNGPSLRLVRTARKAAGWSFLVERTLGEAMTIPDTFVHTNRLGADPAGRAADGGAALTAPPRPPAGSTRVACVHRHVPDVEWVRMPEPQHPVASADLALGRETKRDANARHPRHRLTVPSIARARVHRPECFRGPEANRLRVWRTAPHRANGCSFSCCGVDGIEPPPSGVRAQLVAPRRANALEWGRGTWFGPGVGVVAEKYGQATVATETSRGPHPRDAFLGLPV